VERELEGVIDFTRFMLDTIGFSEYKVD